MIWRASVSGASLVLALLGPAKAETNCSLHGDERSCVRVVGCFGDGRLFHGRALGHRNGTVAGTVNDGTLCTGTWDSRGVLKKAFVTCENELEAGVIYVYQDPSTGTVTGRGRTSDGSDVTVWSGVNVLEYFSEQGFEPGTVECNGAPIPIS